MLSINLSKSKDVILINYSEDTNSISETGLMKSDIIKTDVFANNQGISIYTLGGEKYSFLPNQIGEINNKQTKFTNPSSTIETSEDIAEELRLMIGGTYNTITGETGVIYGLKNSNELFSFTEESRYTKLSVSTSSDGRGVIKIKLTLADGVVLNQTVFANDAYNIDLPINGAPIIEILFEEISNNPTDIIYNTMSK